MSRKPKGYYSSWTLERFKEEVEKLGAESRSDLRKKDNSLYVYALKMNGWLDDAFGDPLHRDFSDLTIDDFKKRVEKLGSKSRNDLVKKDRGLYCYAFRQVGWLDAAFGPSITENHRDYSDWTFKNFKNEVEKLGAKSRIDLRNKDAGLYQYALKQVGWFDSTFGSSANANHRDYSGWTAERFKEEVERMNVKSRSELMKKDKGLHTKALRNEGWLDCAFGSVKKKHEALTLQNFIRIVEEFGYSSRWELGKNDYSLYEYALKQDGWFDSAFGPIKGKYADLTLNNFVRIVEELGCDSKNDLSKKDQGLYVYARKQDGWLEAAFSDSLRYDFSGWDLERFKDEVEKISAKSRKDLQEKSNGLYIFGYKQGWLGAVFGSKGYSGLTLENFVRIVQELGYVSKSDLQKKELGLYAYLRRKGWLDVVFSKTPGSIDSLLESYVTGEVDE